MPLTFDVESKLFGGRGRDRTLFRKMLAALDTKHKMGLPPEFFGLSAEGKSNDRGETTLGIGTYAGGLRLVAIGSKTCELLADKAPKIHSALITEANALIPMNARSGEHEFELLPFERRMVIRNLCGGHAKKGNYWYGAAEAAQKGASWMTLVDRKVPNYLTQCIIKQGVILAQDGDDCHGGLEQYIVKALQVKGTWSDAHSDLKARLGIKLQSVAGHSWLKRDNSNSLVVLHDVEFTIRANLIGPWFAGRMKIEARGEFINATRTALVTSTECAEVAT